jgi:hypothetical protein
LNLESVEQNPHVTFSRIPYLQCSFLPYTQLIYFLMIHFVTGTTPSEWTNQEENHDDVAPLAEVQQKLKLRHARTVKTTYLLLPALILFTSKQLFSLQSCLLLFSILSYHVLSLFVFPLISRIFFFSISVHLFSLQSNNIYFTPITLYNRNFFWMRG